MMLSGDFYVQAALWSQVVAAALFIGVLVWLWRRFILPAIMAAQARQNEQIARAERHREEARATLDLLKEEIEGARLDAKLIGERATAQAAREYDAIMSEAREAGDRALADAQLEFERALAVARLRLREELLAKALERAREEASRRVDAAVDAAIVERFVVSLAAPNVRERARG
jgi:F0F1-type ATP synthase membrane subunit b/b'